MSVRSFHTNISTVLPYTPSVASTSTKDAPVSSEAKRNSDMHRLMLWFYKDEKLESQYAIFYADRQTTTLRRIYIALITILGVFFGFYLNREDSNDFDSAIACSIIAIMMPIFLLAFSFTKHFRRWFMFASVSMSVIGCICIIHLTSLDEENRDGMAIVVYLFCAYTFLIGLNFPAVVLMHVVIITTTMVEWDQAGFFHNTQDKTNTFFRFFCTSILFGYAAYKNDYLFRRVFLSTYQLRTDNRDLKHEVVRLKQLEQTKPEDVDLDSPMFKVITSLKDVRLALGGDSQFNKDVIQRLDAVIDTLVHNTDIFSPNLAAQMADTRKQIDGDVQNWVLSELANKEKTSSGNDSGTTRRPSFPSTVKRRRSSSGLRGLGLVPFSLRPASEVQELDPDYTLGIAKFLESHIDQWNFDSFAFAEKCNGRPLFHLANYLFKRYQLLTKFDIDPIKLDTFLKLIESTYHQNNPYHNSVHATDVLQSAHHLLVSSGIISSMDDLEIFAVIIACIIHDVDHPGRTNIFMVASESEHALLYNDKSVLENHHTSTGFRIIKESKSNILENMSKQERKTLRGMIIDLVLATDLSMHFDIVGKFKSKLEAEDLRSSKENMPMILKIVVKCADVSNPAKPDYIYTAWVDRIMTEFYIQGDEESKLALPISPFMDRANPTVEKCQCGFMDFIVKPLFEAYSNFCKDMTYLRILENNRQFYGKKLAALTNPVPSPQITATSSSSPLASPQLTASGKASSTTSVPPLNVVGGGPTQTPVQPMSRDSDSTASTPK